MGLRSARITRSSRRPHRASRLARRPRPCRRVPRPSRRGPSWTPIPTRPTTSPTPDPLAGPPTLTATPIPQLDSSRMGIQLASNMGRVEWDASLTRAKELGVKWIKVQVDWNFLQPNGYDPAKIGSTRS
ncbi:MAG: hypothetical protein HND48_11720 [Chloroflexi bacterium]|nr:hypothetical protein [Chloroflexota bacterium]